MKRGNALTQWWRFIRHIWLPAKKAPRWSAMPSPKK